MELVIFLAQAEAKAAEAGLNLNLERRLHLDSVHTISPPLKGHAVLPDKERKHKNHKSSILVAKSVLLRECSKLHKGGFALGVALTHPNEKTAAN